MLTKTPFPTKNLMIGLLDFWKWVELRTFQQPLVKDPLFRISENSFKNGLPMCLVFNEKGNVEHMRFVE